MRKFNELYDSIMARISEGGIYPFNNGANDIYGHSILTVPQQKEDPQVAQGAEKEEEEEEDPKGLKKAKKLKKSEEEEKPKRTKADGQASGNQ